MNAYVLLLTIMAPATGMPGGPAVALRCAQAGGGQASSWSGFKEGSTVVYEIVMRRRMVETRIQRRVTIVRVDRLRILLKQEDFDDEGKPVEARELNVSASGALAAEARRTERGRETIEVDGRKIDCHVVEEKITVGGRTTVRTRWTAAESPVGLVKEELSVESEGKRRTQTTRLLRLGEELKLSTGALSCAVFEMAGEEEDGAKIRRKEWLSPKVPGHLARSEETSDDGLVRTIEIAEVRAR